MRCEQCEICGGTLDFGEQRICYECKENMQKENHRKRKLDRMVCATDFKQIEMEELLK